MRDNEGQNMLKMEKRTKKTLQEVVQKLKIFFGKGGLGLDLKEETPTCLTFEGGGGYVTAALCEEDTGTRVDLATQEWDYQVKEFASRLG
jgi:hypothetical protein